MTRLTLKTKRPARPSGLATVAGTLAGSLVSLIGGWLLYSKFGINHSEDLPKAINADREAFFSDSGGRVSYYADRRRGGRPVVLVHSVNAAASAFEMRSLFEHYRGQRSVYALDLPGFGLSERSPRIYTPQLYADTLIDFLATQVKSPADVVALSLSGEFATRAALAVPQWFHSLTLISPTGLGSEETERGSQQRAGQGAAFTTHKALSFPLWAQGLYDLIATRTSIRYFLQQSFLGPVPEEMVEYAYRSAHQPGARFAPFYFLSGVLFTDQILDRYYRALRVPTLMLYDRDPFTGFTRLPELVQSSEWIEAARVVNTCGLPHIEKPAETTAEMDRFWASLPEPSTAG
jgi:pimeloyl-ACP methyl ester carboxylesterase